MNDQPNAGRLPKRLERANVYLARNDLVAARAAYEAILAVLPGFPGAALPLLRLAETQGRFRDAQALAIEMAPAAGADVEATLRIAQGLVRHGESPDAIRLLREVQIADCRDPNIEQPPVRHRLFGWLSWLARSSGNACVYAVKE